MRIRNFGINQKLVFASCFLLFYSLSVLINLNILPLGGEEPRRAIISIEMLQSGHFIAPSIFGWNYYNKPPLFNWFLSLLMFLFGSSAAWVVRLPSLFTILTWTIIHFFIAKKFLSSSIAALSSLFLLTCADVYFYGLQNGGEIDFFYSFIVYLQVISIFYFGYNQQWLKLFALSYLFCGLGFLTKGFPSLLFQVLTLCTLATYFRSYKPILKKEHLVGIGVFTLLIGGFLYLYHFYGSSRLLLINLLNECFKKTAVGEHSEKLWEKVFTYPLLFFKFLLPWSLLLLLLFKKTSIKLWENPLIKFSILFILFNIGVYWFTGKPKLRYTNMFLPFFFTIFAFIYAKVEYQYPKVLNKMLKYCGILFVLLFFAIIGLPFFEKTSLFLVVALSLIVITFIFFYFKAQQNRIIWFISGIVLIRFVYALLFVPIQQQHTRIKYDNLMSQMVEANKFKPVVYWTPPKKRDFEIDVKYKKWVFGSEVTPPDIYFHIPYYYYRATGYILLYDTLLKNDQAYLTKSDFIHDKDVNVLWTWNNEEEQYVLFQTKPAKPITVANSIMKH